jgi:hypothetical protein
MSGNNSDVIPAKAGIQRSMSAGQESYDARMRFWIPVFAGITCFFVFFLSVFLSPTARAQESAAQALYGVQEILVRPVHFDDPAAAKSCRLVGSDVDELIMKELKDNGLPVVAEKDARPSLTDVPRILLVPQIVPFNSQGMDCVTWTALSAESRNHLRVLPIQIPRVVNVIYWRYGEMVASAVSVHGEHVSASLHNMIRQFGQRYTQAQPPTVGRPTAPAPR